MTEQYQKLLAIVRFQLFGGEKPQLNDSELSAVLKEAEAQTVMMTVFPFVRDRLRETEPAQFARLSERFFGSVLTNTENFLEHDELHRLMTENKIPYSTLKGLASAYYYPEAAVREMGDVDFLVEEKDFEKAKRLVLDAGFAVDHGDGEDSIHLAFKRAPRSIWEQHRCINGIPSGETGERIKEEIARTIPTAELVTLDGATCLIPDKLHHGLIMLLHMISHMTSEGIGLRHLCDWAVFANAIWSSDFSALFEEKLKSYGLWKFAQMMTLCAEKYLGIRHKEWAQNSSVSDAQLEDVMEDILGGGNFGKKDMNRYREIKYISNRGERTVDGKNVISQVFATLNQKVYDDYAFIQRHKVFLPIGWAVESGKYIGLLVTGQRKNKDTAKMLAEASKRKSIYSQMALFQSE